MSEIFNLENDLCRCCHAQGGFDNLAVPQSYLEQLEIYSDMLKDCFNIEIAPVPGELCAITYKICKSCIKKLRNASNFRKQVKNCEERFLEMYYKNKIKVLNSSTMPVVKEEVQDLDVDVGVFKQEAPPHIDDDDDDEDLRISDEDKEERDSTDEEVNLVNIANNVGSIGTDKKLKKPGRPRRSDIDKNCQKERQSKRMKFRLQPGDYKKDGDRVVCSHCDRVYYKLCSLRFHIKTKHYKVPQYKCAVCSKEFMTLAPFTIHKLEAHNLDERFNCNACKGTFNTKVQLRKHINNFHMLGEKYKCGLCDYESFSFEGMYKHKFKHKTSKDYHCKFCPKSFLRKTTLDLHERIHTGDRRKVCKVCNQAFVQKSSLNYHMSKYHPEVNY